MIAAVSLVVVIPASAGHAASQRPAIPTPRADEWWFTTWKVLPKVWPVTQGAGVTVAVVDSGVQANVQDLRGAVVPGGDLTGHNTNGETDFSSAGDGHGTEMAVLIAGQGFGTGMLGMALKAKILPVVVNANPVDQNANPATVAAGIKYAADHGAQVIDVPQVYPSPSASGCDPVEQAAVAYAIARDAVVIAPSSSTNLIGDRPSEPGSCAGVLAVGAIQQDRSLWPGNGREPYLTAVAAGAGLISSGRDGQLVTGFSGSRAASAQVSAVVALVRSEFPALRWYQVVQHIIGTALPEGGRVPNDSSGFGIVRLSHLVDPVTFPVPASTPNPVFARYLAWLTTAQGRSVSPSAARRNPGATAGLTARQHGATIMTTGSIVAVLLLIAGAAVLLTAKNRRPRPRPTRHRSSARGFRTPPVPGPAELSRRAEPLSSVLLEEDLLPPEMGPYRVPPYSPSPVPEPRASTNALPLVSDGDFYFPDGAT